MSAEPIEPIEVGVYEAKTHLSQLIDKVEEGNVIFITRHGKRSAQLTAVPDPEPAAKRPFGGWENYWVADGWEEFTGEDARLWYGGDVDWSKILDAPPPGFEDILTQRNRPVTQ